MFTNPRDLCGVNTAIAKIQPRGLKITEDYSVSGMGHVINKFLLDGCGSVLGDCTMEPNLVGTILLIVRCSWLCACFSTTLKELCGPIFNFERSHWFDTSL